MASVSGVNSNGLNFGGLATGIDTDKLVAGLTRISQQRIDALKARQAGFASKQATFAALQGRLFDLQTKAGKLARAAGGAFDTRKATSSDTTALTAAAGSSAAVGTYSLTVAALAQAHQVTSQGFSDPNTRLKEGTLTLQVGSGAAVTVTIDSRNNTLQGLADAINAAGSDVKAAVINDGSASPYRLMLTSARTGAANSIVVTNNLTQGSGASLDPTNTVVQAAADAEVKLGNGGITVFSSTNQVNGLIPGVTVNLLRADPARPVTLTVANDTAAISQAVQDFVSAYNAVQDFINERTTFDKETRQAGILLGNRDAAELADELAAALTVSVPGLNPAANRLSSVGLSFDDKGRLQLDQAKLDQALSGQNGATLADIKRLFALSGTSNHSGISFTFGTEKTRPTNGSPYTVQITSPATRGAAVASSALAGTTTFDMTNNKFTLKVNGVLSSEITLDTGVAFTPETLAAHVQQKINTNAALAGNLVTVDLDGGKLRITSHTYGSGSKVEFGTGNALGAGQPLGFVGTESGTGTDVAGHFVVNGQTENATGSGQVLTGNSGNANTDGLQVRATLAGSGSASLTVDQGFASRLNQVLSKYLDATKGRLKTVNDTFQRNIADLDQTIARHDALLEEKKNDLIRQFAAMESAVSRLKGLGNQLASLILPTNLAR